VTAANACTTGAKKMAKSIKDAVEAKIDELNGAGEALVFDELDGIVTALFSDATGFNQIEESDRRSLCRLLFAVHLDRVEENWEEDGDDGDDNGDGGNGGGKK